MDQSLLFETDIPKPIDLPGYPAVFSADRKYRYVLWRTWTDNPKPSYALWIGVNPSDANEEDNDPTLTRVVNFSKSWGFEAVCMANLNGFVSPYPEVMMAADDCTGEDNDYWLARVATDASIRIACWGVGGKHLNRDRAVSLLLPELHCLKLNKDGTPLHPLYASGSLAPIPFKIKRQPIEPSDREEF
jgi:hypothetical protein